MTSLKPFSGQKRDYSNPLRSFALWFSGDDPLIARQKVMHGNDQGRIHRPQTSSSSRKSQVSTLSENNLNLGSDKSLELSNSKTVVWKDRIFPVNISSLEKEIEFPQRQIDLQSSEPWPQGQESSIAQPFNDELEHQSENNEFAEKTLSTTFVRERRFLERCLFGNLFDQEQFLSQLNANHALAQNSTIAKVQPSQRHAIASFPQTKTTSWRSPTRWFSSFVQPMPMAVVGVLALPILLSSTRLQPEFKSLNLQSAFGWGQRPQTNAANVIRLKWNEAAANIPNYLLLPGFRPPQGRFTTDNLPQLQTAQQKPVLPPKPAGNHQPIPLRVAIAEGASSVNVQLSGTGLVTDEQGNLLGEIPPEVSLVAQSDGTGINLDRFYQESILWIKTKDPTSLIAVNGKWYRGSVQLKTRGQDLLAINHVELEQYLYSVVGTEMMPSWPLEALKAQAVAARSYAIAHIVRPANQDFDIGATPQWQAYQGFAKEADTTRAAVDETRGLLLAYKGNIVETLYASSDSLVQEVHQGFGMSQEGAMGLAEQRFNYQQILDYFYPGTRLAWLQLSQ